MKPYSGFEILWFMFSSVLAARQNVLIERPQWGDKESSEDVSRYIYYLFVCLNQILANMKVSYCRCTWEITVGISISSSQTLIGDVMHFPLWFCWGAAHWTLRWVSTSLYIVVFIFVRCQRTTASVMANNLILGSVFSGDSAIIAIYLFKQFLESCRKATNLLFLPLSFNKRILL